MTVTLPETRYARNNGLYVAYQLVGDGPVDVVLLTQWFSNIGVTSPVMSKARGTWSLPGRMS